MSLPTLTFPLGMLKTFVAVGGATFTFSGPSSPPHNVHEEILDTFVSLPDKQYPVDMQGVGAAPWKPVEASWDYLLRAADGVSHAQAYQDLEGLISGIRSFFRGDTGAYTGGTRGVLAAYQADQTSVLSCPARCKTWDITLVSGTNTRYYIMPITFVLLDDWT